MSPAEKLDWQMRALRRYADRLIRESEAHHQAYLDRLRQPATIIANAIAARDMAMDDIGHAPSPDLAATRILAALEAAGYVIAPVEPTDAMVGAGVDQNDVWGIGRAECKAIYRAMLVARPR